MLIGPPSYRSKKAPVVFWGDHVNLDDLILEGDKLSDVSKVVNVDAIPPDGGIDSDDIVLLSGENDAVPSVTLTSLKEFSAVDLSEPSLELQSILNVVMSVPV